MSNTNNETGTKGIPTKPRSGDGQQPVHVEVAGWRRLWDHWMKMAHALGVVQTRVLMVVFYFIVVMPLGIFMRMRGDPLHLKPSTASNWTPHLHQERSLESTRNQF